MDDDRPCLKLIFKKGKNIKRYYREVESFTIYTINFSIHGSYKRFFDKLYEDSRDQSSIFVYTTAINKK